VYRPVTRGEIADALVHMRDLYRQIKPSDEREYRASERREVGIKTLLSNLSRTKDHPTLHMIDEVADMARLTIEGAHRLFGYNLADIRRYDLELNGGRTHIIESYAFDRDRLIDLPLEFVTEEISGFGGMLGDMVTQWQTDIPIRVLEEAGWLRPGTFFVHVGTEDSLGSSLPPGSLALVEPIDDDDKLYPSPRAIYLLQFGNGYRCSRCVVSRGKLQLPTAGGGHKPEPELDKLSNIIKAFNDQFGNIDWKDGDKIRQVIAEEIPAKVAADKAYQNAMKNSDRQNARIEHDKALQRVILELLADHAELFKQFSDNPSFKKWLGDTNFMTTYTPEPPDSPRP